VYIFVRTTLDTATVGRTTRNVISRIDASLPTTELGDMHAVIDRPAALRRFPLVLFAAFSVLAVVLAGIGIYAVVAYTVAQRTRELGVRMALGAQPGSVITLVLRQGLRPILVGVAVGLVGACVTAFLMRNMLFGVKPFDLPTFAVIPLFLCAVGTLACLLPARRATKIDPMIALRSE
jgi:putative ABC transport system permease protein